MPPQTDQNTTEPADFDFMLKQQPAQPSQGPAGKFSRLNLPAKLLIAAVGGLIIAIVAAVVLAGGSNNSQKVLDLMAQSEEILRVSKLQDQQLRDESTKGLSATVQTVLMSQKAQLESILSKSNVKYGTKELAARQNKQTDSELQTAAQNNKLDSAYVAYLKNSLTSYLGSVRTTLNASTSQTLKTTLQSAYNSTDTLLKSPQFKS